MKTSFKKVVVKPFLSTVLLGLGASQLLVLPLLADEFTNISEIKDCRAIQGASERLLCYDTVVDGGIFNQQQLKQVQVENFGSRKMPKEKTPAPSTATGTASAPSTAAGTASAPSTAAGTASAPAPSTAIGTVSAPAPSTAIGTASTPAASGTKVSVDRLTVTITRTKKDAGGIYYFQTSDGQVWKQTNASRWSTAVPFEAKIKAGAFGSFFLVNEGGKSTRVKRVR